MHDKLAELTEPFFRLKHGRLYECKVLHDDILESTTIIPLAFKSGKNCQFVMIDARKLFCENYKFVYEIIEMEFDFILNDGIHKDYPFEYDASTILCATQEDNSILDFNDTRLFDFKETNEI